MGTIPAYGTSAGIVPSGQTLPRADVNAFTAPAAGAAREAAAIADIGQGFAEKYVNAKLEVDAADQTADMSKKLQEVQFNASKIPDRAQATAAYDAGSQKVFDDYDQGFHHPLVKAHVTSRFLQEQNLRRADTQNASFRLESQTQNGKLITQLDQYGKDAANANDPRLREKLIEDGVSAIDGRVAGGWMNPEKGAEAKIAFKSSVYRSLVDTTMAKDQKSGIALYDELKKHNVFSATDESRLNVQTEEARKNTTAEDIVNKALPVPGGISDNNIGNVRPVGSSTGFQTVGSFDEGVALTVNNARAYPKAFNGGQNMTLGQIGSKWAPAGDGANNPAQWAKNVAAESGLPLDKPIDLNDPETAAKFAKGVHKAEKGTSRPVGDYMPGVLGQAAPSTGDVLQTFRVTAMEEMQKVEASDMSPEIKSRVLAKLQQRAQITEGLVTSQRKAITDQLDTVTTGMQTDPANYKPGTLVSLSQKMRQTGDFSEAARIQYLADHESQLLDLAHMPPSADKRALAHMLGGTAGKIASAMLADDASSKSEFRKEAAIRTETLNKGVTDGTSASSLIETVQEGVQYYMAAGDRVSAQKLIDKWQSIAGAEGVAKLPPAQAQATLRDLQERLNSPGGFSANDQRLYDVGKTMVAAKADAWKTNPLAAAPTEIMGGPLGQFPDLASDPVQFQLAINDRTRQAEAVSRYMDPRASTQVSVMQPQEASEIKTRWAKASVQTVQAEAGKLAMALKPEQVSLVAHQIAGENAGADPFSDAVAMAMMHYRRAMPGDKELGDSIIAGADFRKNGGKEGAKAAELDAASMTTLQESFGTARVGMSGSSVRAEDNAVLARYTDLMRQQGKTSPEPGLLQKAAKEVGGELNSWKNGGQILLPTGVTPTQFRDAVWSLTPADIPPMAAVGGRQIDKDRIWKYGTFVTQGDGVYKVQMPDGRTGIPTDLVRSDTGKPWTLDIRPLTKRSNGISVDPATGLPMQGPQ